MSNTDSIEISASTVEQAISEALEQLGAGEDDVSIEVLATPRSGVLGLGVRQARVRVTRRPPPEARSGVSAPPPAPAVRKAAVQPPPAPQATPAPAPARRAAPAPQTASAPAAPRAPRRQRTEEGVEEETGEGARKAANAEEQATEAKAIIQRILELMGERAEIELLEGGPESIALDLKGDGSGILIGRHGQTLDALEYLVNRIVARRIKDPLPVVLDTESYRARRRQQLHHMALSMGERAKREHAPVKLDPMPPRDRRIIHLALKDDPLLTTRSAGEGFMRAVEIFPVGERRERNERETKRDRERDRQAVGEQGGFKRGQKKIV
jgi:spoIIIJ-associated protein